MVSSRKEDFPRTVLRAHPDTAPTPAGVVGAPDSDPARFDKIPIHAGSESGAPGECPDAPSADGRKFAEFGLAARKHKKHKSRTELLLFVPFVPFCGIPSVCFLTWET